MINIDAVYIISILCLLRQIYRFTVNKNKINTKTSISILRLLHQRFTVNKNNNINSSFSSLDILTVDVVVLVYSEPLIKDTLKERNMRKKKYSGMLKNDRTSS